MSSLELNVIFLVILHVTVEKIPGLALIAGSQNPLGHLGVGRKRPFGMTDQSQPGQKLWIKWGTSRKRVRPSRTR